MLTAFTSHGFMVSRGTFQGVWEVIQPAVEVKLEISYRWFPTSKDAEVWCFKEGIGETSLSTISNKQLDIELL